ncbi:MAG: FAD-dependent oxidoreductase [Verrucomicrobiota bacterium]
MNTQPLWSEGIDRPRYPTLSENVNTEVLVIGGGITGISTAHLLARTGLKVTLLERDRLGCGDTAHTTAHLTYMTDTRLSDLVRVCGEEKALLSWIAGSRAMDRILRTSRQLGVDVELREVPGYLVAAESDDIETEVRRMEEEAEMARSLGFHVRLLDNVAPTGRPGLLFPQQLKFHPLKYLHALAAEAQRAGVRIHELSDVSEFGENPRHVIANGHRVKFDQVVIATHVPLQGSAGTVGASLFQTKLASYSTYAIAAKASAGTLPEMIWSDTADPFHYLRVNRSPEGDVIIWGGEDHKTGQVLDTSECFDRLEQSLLAIAPVAQVSHRWSGQVVETVDGLPYIGENEDGQFIATGFSGNGMTFGVAAAMIIRDKIIGQHNDLEDAFSPCRKELAALGNYLRENKDFPYLMIKDRIGIEETSPEQLKVGEGVVLKLNDENVAACRDAAGALHCVSAVCPHLGCIVAWNDSEQTWDCPCHGSRFEADGTLIAGPAEEDLRPIPARS